MHYLLRIKLNNEDLEVPGEILIFTPRTCKNVPWWVPGCAHNGEMAHY